MAGDVVSGVLRRVEPRKVLLALAAPVLAFLAAILLTSLVLVVSGSSPVTAFTQMWDFGTQPGSIVNILNKAAGYYLAALAVAVGFRMNLFNIGVDGQYRLAAMLAAVVGASVDLPAPLHVALIVLVAVLVGAAWAGIAGLLKVYRGVSEVISTIMLNFIATSVVAWMLTPDVFAELSNNIVKTPEIPTSGWFPGFTTGSGEVHGFIVVSALVGVLYWFVLTRTRFGFDLRATGASEPAALASGVDIKRMVLYAMLISGGIAGLVGMPLLLGASHSYGQDFPAGIGFTGIAIALLGRNSAVGIAFASVLWGFLDVSQLPLDLEGIPKEIIIIMQGTIVLAVVIAYEVMRRVAIAAEQRRVAAELRAPAGPAAPQPTGTGAR
jgi:simple sugar transport system permease protein